MRSLPIEVGSKLMEHFQVEKPSSESQKLEDSTPFAVQALPVVGYLFFAGSFLVALLVGLNSMEKDSSQLIGILISIGILVQGIVIGGLLIAVGYIVALLENIADSVRD